MATVVSTPVAETPVAETVINADEKQNTLADLKKALSNVEEFKKNLTTITTSLRKGIKDYEKIQKDYTKIQNKKFKRKANADNKDGVKKEPSGITKPSPISTELADFLGLPHDTLLARTETTKLITTYVKSNDLQDPENRRRFILTENRCRKGTGCPHED